MPVIMIRASMFGHVVDMTEGAAQGQLRDKITVYTLHREKQRTGLVKIVVTLFTISMLSNNTIITGLN